MIRNKEPRGATVRIKGCLRCRVGLQRAVTGRSIYLLLAMAGSGVMLVPFVALVLVALGVYSFFPPYFPHPIDVSSFPRVYAFASRDNPAWLYAWNSTWYTALEVVGETMSSAVIGYGFARLRAPGATALFVLALATVMVPFEATFLPKVVLFSKLGWIDTPLPMIVPAFFGNPLYIFLFRQFFRTIPREIEEAATLDGLGYLGTFVRIHVPLSYAAVFTVGVLSFTANWNDVFDPLIYLNTTSKYPLPYELLNLFGQIPSPYVMAAAVLCILPCLIPCYLFLRFAGRGLVVQAAPSTATTIQAAKG